MVVWTIRSISSTQFFFLYFFQIDKEPFSLRLKVREKSESEREKKKNCW